MTSPRRPVEADVSWQTGLEHDRWARLLRLLFDQETDASAEQEPTNEQAAS